ncbi:MAG: M60 family metallopeptidase [Paludibacteraceae bacterium]
MRKVIFTILSLVVCFTFIAKAEITTPYPETIELKQINSAEKERIRLCQAQKKYDKQPTGFYVESGKKVVVNVEILTPADQNVMPVITVGTLGFNVGDRNTGVSTTLTQGNNTITNHSGGLIWLSFVQSGNAEPKGQARVTFTATSEHVRVPRFVYGVTTNMEFTEMLTTYTTPDVLFQSDYVVVVATQEAAKQYSDNINKVAWLNALHTLLNEEDKISGLDNNDPNPLHHRMNLGEVRFLLTQNTSDNPHASSAGYTGYPSGSIKRYLTEIGTPTNNTWMLGHEIGHQHQQPAYLINQATESTVNIYSYVVERNIQGETYNRTTAARWATTQNTYLKLPFSKRIYDMDTDSLESVIGFNRDELRFMVWEQMFLLFGDQYYKTLHRVVREEKVLSGAADERRAYLIWKSSQITGYDLTEFFNLWGIRVTDATIKAKLRAEMADAKSKSEILDLSTIGRTAEDLTNVTGQALPTWAPITMRGITSSVSSIPEMLDKSDWTITTSYAGIADASIGGDQPIYIIDSNTSTAFAFVKPGKTYGGQTVPGNVLPTFTVDMKTAKSFNYITYMHRIGNTSEALRARQLSIYGSNDGTQFTLLKDDYMIDYTKNADVVTVEFPAVSYRYVGVVIDDWNKTSGNTIQVAEFNVGTKIAEEILPVPDPIKFKVNITADAGIITSQAGVNLEDEDSDYIIDFSLAPEKALSKITVDGVAKTPTLSNGTYSLTVKVTNHLDVNITSEPGATGLNSLSSISPVKVYPNPVKAGQSFSIRMEGNHTDAKVSVYSPLGTKLYESILESNVINYNFDQQGTYIIRVANANDMYTAKLVVK